MRRLCAIFSMLVALALGGAAYGIVGGSDDTTHTFVGAALQQQVQNGVTGNERCSGFLISATTFVTAAHCFDPSGADVRITFAQDYLDATAAFIQVPASAVVNSPDADIAVIAIPAQPGPYAVLPSAAESLGVNDTVTVVGYGVHDIQGKTIDRDTAAQRRFATTKLANAGSQTGVFLKLLTGPGACFGDSGGPNLDGQGQVVAITSYTNAATNCNGVSYSLRVDDPSSPARQFIAAHS